LDINIKNLAVFEIGGVEIWITQTTFGTWVIMAVLTALAITVRVKIKKFQEVPSGFQNVIESLVEMFLNYYRTNAGEKLMYLGNWFFMMFSFILLSNISGMFFLRPPTADWTMTFAFALVAFILIQVLGIRYRKMGYLKDLCRPVILFLPLNVIGELARPVALSFRLFGNVLAGTILMTLLYEMAPYFMRFVIPIALHMYFDLFAGALQTFIITTLSISFIGAASTVES